jgi:hypothetical protein
VRTWKNASLEYRCAARLPSGGESGSGSTCMHAVGAKFQRGANERARARAGVQAAGEHVHGTGGSWGTSS